VYSVLHTRELNNYIVFVVGRHENAALLISRMSTTYQGTNDYH